MWNLNFTPPEIIDARVFSRMPDSLRKPQRSAWADANKPGHVVDSFLEGPVFDQDGNFFVTDVPHGRIFCVASDGAWTEVARTEGWPNGLALHSDGSLWVADYRRGLLRCEPKSGRIDVLLGHRNSESFKGLNDLCFDHRDNLYMTDQGQSGLHDPTGRVYRLGRDGRLEVVVSGIASPNGIALGLDDTILYVAVTRANQIWRGPILPDLSISKMGAFRTFFGTSGPDGLAVTADSGLVVAHASLGGAFLLNARGEVTHFIRSPVGSTVTNIAFQPGTSRLLLTESHSGSVLEANLPCVGLPLPGHA